MKSSSTKSLGEHTGHGGRLSRGETKEPLQFSRKAKLSQRKQISEKIDSNKTNSSDGKQNGPNIPSLKSYYFP
jgi:hypothetical protein